MGELGKIRGGGGMRGFVERGNFQPNACTIKHERLVTYEKWSYSIVS
jgi:hypothetical protein